jgi:hypothetical protein
MAAIIYSPIIGKAGASVCISFSQKWHTTDFKLYLSQKSKLQPDK